MEEYLSTKSQSEIKNAFEQIQDNKKLIKYDTRDYVIEHIVNKFRKDEFFVPLEYQRNFIWDDKDKCNFIESLLIGLPIPFMFFSDTDDGRVEIVDGAQRVQTMVQFAENDLVLSNLKVLSDSNGFRFGDFDIAIQRRFLNTSVRVVYLEEGTTVRTRQEIFKRINTGGIRVEPREVRRGALEGKFMDFLTECSKNDLFNALAPRSDKVESRFEGLELVSRFFAYYDSFSSNFDGYDGKVAQYIDKYVDNKNKQWQADDSEKEIYKQRFEDMLNFAQQLLGKRGFRKTLKANSTPRARFEAISVGIALALSTGKPLYSDNSQWIDSEEFKEITSSDAANNKSRLIGRIVYVRDNLLNEVPQ